MNLRLEEKRLNTVKAMTLKQRAEDANTVGDVEFIYSLNRDRRIPALMILLKKLLEQGIITEAFSEKTEADIAVVEVHES
jgi:hypothetical protein